MIYWLLTTFVSLTSIAQTYAPDRTWLSCQNMRTRKEAPLQIQRILVHRSTTGICASYMKMVRNGYQTWKASWNPPMSLQEKSTGVFAGSDGFKFQGSAEVYQKSMQVQVNDSGEALNVMCSPFTEDQFKDQDKITIPMDPNAQTGWEQEAVAYAQAVAKLKKCSR